MSLIDTLKAAHRMADLAKAKIAEATAEAEAAARHIEALPAVLNDAEKAVYEEFLKAKAAVAAKV